MQYKHFFGFQKEPFVQEITIDNLYPLPELEPLNQRFGYCISLGAVGIITGEIGSGKSTSLRYACHNLHPSEYRIISLVAHTSSINEFLRQSCLALGEYANSNSITRLLKLFRELVMEHALKRQHPVLLIDEAHLLRNEIFVQLHTFAQFEFDSKPVLPIILCGQTQLIDKLHTLASRAFASRIVAKTHLQALNINLMKGYLNHHLAIAGIKEALFTEQAILAIHQGSGGLLRRANILARGALIAATADKTQSVSAEHVRIASTEVL